MKLILLLLCSINNWLTCIILVMCSMLVNNLCFQVLSGINHNLKWWAISHRIQRICVKYFFSGFCLWHLIKHWMGRGGGRRNGRGRRLLCWISASVVDLSNVPIPPSLCLSLSLSLSLSLFLVLCSLRWLFDSVWFSNKSPP